MYYEFCNSHIASFNNEKMQMKTDERIDEIGLLTIETGIVSCGADCAVGETLNVKIVFA